MVSGIIKQIEKGSLDNEMKIKLWFIRLLPAYICLLCFVYETLTSHRTRFILNIWLGFVSVLLAVIFRRKFVAFLITNFFLFCLTFIMFVDTAELNFILYIYIAAIASFILYMTFYKRIEFDIFHTRFLHFFITMVVICCVLFFVMLIHAVADVFYT